MKRTSKLRVVITAGAGGQGEQFIRLLLERPELDLVALVESYNVEEARARARSYNQERRLQGRPQPAHQGRRRTRATQRSQPPKRPCRVVATIEEAIAEVDFDLAIVCSRPEEHAREIIALLEANKYVLAEKPPTATLEEMVAVAHAEGRSKGWVAWNFQLFWQWLQLRDVIRDGKLGAALAVQAVWIRGPVAESDQAAAEQGVRRGQRGRPMIDLCHMIHAALIVLRKVTPVRVLGFSVEDGGTAYETLTATVLAEFEGREIQVQLSIRCGFDISLGGKHTLEEVRLEYLGVTGHGVVNGLVDERVIGGLPVAPRDFLPSITVRVPAADGKTQRVEKIEIPSPQPPTVYECYGKTLDWVVGMIRSGEQHRGGRHGIRVMQLLEAFTRSSETGHEVDVTAIAGIE